jgi:FkbM family methyltransferase
MTVQQSSGSPTLVWTNQRELDFLQTKDEYASLLSKARVIGTQERHAVVCDIGGNNGLFALACAKEFPRFTDIYSFEPFESPFRCLEANAKTMNSQLVNQDEHASRITPIKAAVGVKSGAVSGTYLPNYSLLSGFHVSEADRKELERLAGRDLSHEFLEAKEQVVCTRLDEWITAKALPVIDLLKVDVEKAELDVLVSLGQKLSDSVRFVIAEVHEENKQAVVSLLSQAGFADISVSEPAPPTYCLFTQGSPQSTKKTLEKYDPKLNTYLVWAANNTRLLEA